MRLVSRLAPLVLAPLAVALPVALAGCGSAAPTLAAGGPSAGATAAPTASVTQVESDASATAPDATTGAPDPDQSAAESAGADADAAAATASCAGKLTTQATAAVPAGFPTVDGWTPLAKVTQGSATAYKGSVTGTPDDLPAVRDAGLAKLKEKGYALGDHDQEPGAEADGDFDGPRSGTINVRPLCEGHLVVTYLLHS